jgi:hypothetical protein
MRGRIKNITKQELGYMIGLFIGDGYSNYNKKDRHYRVEFHLNSERDKDILKYINQILEKLQLNYFIKKDKRCNAIKTFVNSKEFMFFINEEVIKIKNKRLSKDYKLGLLSGFIDAEGYVNKGITLAQKDKNTLKFFQNITEQLNIKNRLFHTPNYTPKGIKGIIWRLYLSTSFKYLPHNSLKVSRIYGRNCSS